MNKPAEGQRPQECYAVIGLRTLPGGDLSD